MGLKVFGIFLLVVAAAYAENALDSEDPVESQLDDVDEMDDGNEVAETEDSKEDDDDDDDDDEMTEDARRRGIGKKRRRRRKQKIIVVASRGGQCYCRHPRAKKIGKKGDEAEFEEDETVDVAFDEQLEEVDDEEDSDEEENGVEDARRRKGGKRRRRRNAIKKLIRSFFSRHILLKLNCQCTKNRAVIRFLRFIHVARVLRRNSRRAYFTTYARLLSAVRRAAKKRRGGKKGKKGGKGDTN